MFAASSAAVWAHAALMVLVGPSIVAPVGGGWTYHALPMAIGPGVVAEEGSDFWGVRLACGLCANPTLAADINATPFTFVRYGAGDDALNLTLTRYGYNGAFYSDAGQPTPAWTNLSAMNVLAGWDHLRVLYQLNGQPDRPGTVSDELRWIQHRDGILPSAVAVGNEPEGWRHWGIAMPDWQVADASTPTASEFAQEVAAAIPAIRQSYAGPIVCVEASWVFDEYLGTDLRQNGPECRWVAFHDYPGAWGSATPTIAQFLSYQNVSKIEESIRYADQTISSVCGDSCYPALAMDEFNGAIPQGTFCRFLAGPANAILTSAAVAQALEAGLQRLTFFDLWGPGCASLVNSTTGAWNPTMYLYADLLKHFPLGAIHNVTVTNAPENFWAAESNIVADGRVTSENVLLSNCNLASGVTISLSSLPPGSWTIYRDDAGATGSAHYSSGNDPRSLYVPPESAVVLADDL